MKRQRRGFTLLELLVVIAIVALLAGILYPVFEQAKYKARSISCISNQKQLLFGIMMYTQDNDGTYPVTINFNSPQKMLWTQSLLPYVKNQDTYICPMSYQQTYVGFLPVPNTPSQYANSWEKRNFASLGLTAQFTLDKTKKEGFAKVFKMESMTNPASTVILADTPNTNNDASSRAYEGGYMFDPCSPQNENGVPPLWGPKMSFLSTKSPLKSLRGPLAIRNHDGLSIGFADGHAKFQRAQTVREDKKIIWRFRGCP
jgi:prepilin-type N-terminal cleavage/methylation domain-containing protein